MANLVKDTMASLQCDEETANKLISNEVEEIFANGEDMCYDDLEMACENLGIDFDNIAELLLRMC